MTLRENVTLIEARDHAAGLFTAAGIEVARTDATALICAAAGINRAGLISRGAEAMAADARAQFIAYATRRLAREPVSRITGARGFRNIELQVARDVLDPRADSETVIEAAIKQLGGRREAPLDILDIGSGAGALICALLDEFPQARGHAIDISAAACDLTSANARACAVSERLRVSHCGWDMAPAGPFDLVVSNPPYIRTGDISTLDPEVRLWDPVLALDGGADGLDAYRALTGVVRPILRESGLIIVEIGYDQAASVSAIFESAGFSSIQQYRDLTGHIRALSGRIGA